MSCCFICNHLLIIYLSDTHYALSFFINLYYLYRTMGFIMLVSYLNIMYVNHTPCYGWKGGSCVPLGAANLGNLETLRHGF